MASGIAVTVDGPFLFGLAAVLVAAGGFLAQYRTGRKVDEVAAQTEAVAKQITEASTENLMAVAGVHDEVRTKNGMNAGDSIDAILSQGIAAKAPSERTDTDLSHQAHMAANDPSGVVAADQAAAAEREK